MSALESVAALGGSSPWMPSLASWTALSAESSAAVICCFDVAEVAWAPSFLSDWPSRGGRVVGLSELPAEAHRPPARTLALVDTVRVGSGLGAVELEVGGPALAGPALGRVEEQLA